MTRRPPASLLVTLALALAQAVPALSHPAPFSYLDVRLSGAAIEGTLVLHDFDVAHELKLPAPDPLLDPVRLPQYATQIADLVLERVRMNADGRNLQWDIAGIRPLPDRTAIEVAYRITITAPAGHLSIRASLFPYDPAHQTFVNIYEAGALTTQQVLSASRPAME